MSGNMAEEESTGSQVRLAATIALISIAIIFFLRTNPKQRKAHDQAQPEGIGPPVVLLYDHVRGPVGARVTVIEYSDFQCPYSREVHAPLKELAEDSRIRWVYRNFPLTMHPLAEPAARAEIGRASCRERV